MTSAALAHDDSASRSAVRLFMGVSILLFVISLTQNGYHIDDSDDRGWHPAVGLLLVGCLGAFTGVFAWLANPLLVATWTAVARFAFDQHLTNERRPHSSRHRPCTRVHAEHDCDGRVGFTDQRAIGRSLPVRSQRTGPPPDAGDL